MARAASDRRSGPSGRGSDEEELTGKHWRWTVLSSRADYIDAGSIVAAGAGLALWSAEFGLDATTIGLLAAFSSNAISCGVEEIQEARADHRLSV